jgi:RHS repeat-associated protein
MKVDPSNFRRNDNFNYRESSFATSALLLLSVLAIAAMPRSAIADPAPVSDPPIVAAQPARDTTSDKVGTTAGQFRVDEGGNSSYSIPIQVPPGTAGMAPKLALAYNSRLPGGVMGPGWAIQGVSQIIRCRQARENGDFMSGTTPIDGNPAPVNFTTSDRFCLDGVRLLLTGTGTYGANGTTYSPETDPTTQVTAIVTNQAAGPDSFTVKRKDGTTNTYGYTTTLAGNNARATATLPATQSTVNVSWNLARVQDSVGNYIDYLYNWQPAVGTLSFAAGAVEFTLSQVKYSGHATGTASSPYASVTFNYNTLSVPSVRLGYQAGIAFLQSQQLQTVTVTDSTQNPSTLRYYQLTYQTSASGSGFQQVKQVKECRDSSQAVCFAPTKFTWSAANYSFVTDVAQTLSGPGFANIVGYKLADVDGDGRQDVALAINDGVCGSNSSIYIAFLDQSTTTHQMSLAMTTSGGSQTPRCAPINLSGNDRAWYLFDYDGDGRADLMMGGAFGTNWTLYLSTGRPAAGAAAFASCDQLNVGCSPNPLTTPITVAVTTATGLLIDLNGDGLPDFIYPQSNGPFVTSSLNGLAYSDLSARQLTRQADGSYKFSEPVDVYLNFGTDTTCTGSNIQCSIGFLNFDARHGSIISTDVDADGRGDMTFVLTQTTCTPGPCQQAPTGSGVRIHFDEQLGNPSGTAAPATNTNVFFWYQFTAAGISTPAHFSGPVQLMQRYFSIATSGSGINLPTTSDKMFVADLNGDGLADLLYQDTITASNYCVLINRGGGTYSATPICATGITNGNLLQIADINGDGRLDLVYPTAGSASFSYTTLSPDNSSFSAAATVPGGGMTAGGTLAQWINVIGDIDGDGATDFLRVNVASGSNYYSSRVAGATGSTTCLATTNNVTCSRYHAHDSITAITDGNGAVTTIAYQPLTNKGVYQRGSENSQNSAGTGYLSSLRLNTDFGWGSPVFDVYAPLYVVSQVQSSAPIRNQSARTSLVTYRYAGGLMQSGGRGFLGFYETWSFDANDASTVSPNQYIVTVNSYAQRYPIIGMPQATFKLAFPGTTITRNDAALDACAANVETGSYTCFARVGDPLWPELISAGTWAGVSEQTSVCNGTGCRTVDNTACNASMGPVAQPQDLNAGIFTPPAAAAPVFAYANFTLDVQYDLGSSTPTNHVQNNVSNGYFCYEDAYANLTHSRIATQDASNTTIAQKLTANTYTNDTTNWYLGRLTNSQIQFLRPSQTTITRTTDFTYDATTGLLTSERVQKADTANLDLRTMYVLDQWGNRTAAYECSSDLSDASCTSTTSFVQQQSGTQVHRYAKTTFDSIGRYSTGSLLPFYSSGGAGHLNQQTVLSVAARDEFGNAVSQNSINGLNQFTEFGTLGRPYFTADTTGKASTTTLRTCGSGASQAPCTADTMFVFRSQTIAQGAPTTWTYFDVLGRPIMKVSQTFDGNPAGQLFSAACTYYDGHNRPVLQSEPFFVNVGVAADGFSPAFTTSSTSPCSSLSYTTTTTYDVLGRAVNTLAPDGGMVTTTYTGLQTSTMNQRSHAWVTVKNALGEVIETRDPAEDSTTGLTVDTTYDAAGNPLTITRNAGSGAITTQMTYDKLGRKSSLIDPDAGTTTYTYNAAGDQITGTDAKSQLVTQSYDALGRRWLRQTSAAADGNNITDQWFYDTASNGFGLLGSESHSSTTGATISRTMIYDTYGRTYQRSSSIAGNNYTETTAYDGYSRTKAQQDASGYVLSNAYSTKGFLSSQSDSRAGNLYQINTTTARGQVATDQRGGTSALASTITYNTATGRIASTCSGAGCALQNLQYAFDLAGNLSTRSRTASGTTITETLTNDALNRLTQSTIFNGSTNTTVFTASYDKLGNICTKNGVAYTYPGPAGCAAHGSTGSPDQVTKVGTVSYAYDTDGNQSSGNGRTLAYNALNQLSSASQSTNQTTFQYDPEGARFQRVDNSSTTTTYIGGVEILRTGATTETRRYLAGVAIDFVRSSGSNQTLYVFNDHLGSTDVLAGPTGTLTEALSFDVHGNYRNATTWQGTAPETGVGSIYTRQGFTGHEHADPVGLIHMNGRTYDPSMGRMLQADPLAGPGPQGLNRYSYVANNPLSLTDPTGYSWWRDIAATAILVFAPEAWAYFGVEWGVGTAIATGFVAGVVQSDHLNGGLYGAFSAGVFFEVGQAFDNAGWAHNDGTIGSTHLNSVGFTAKILAHGIAGGVISSLEGGKFGSGFLSAGISEAASPGVDRLDPDNPVGQSVSAERVVAASVIGGTASSLSGGKFSNGAITAAFARAFNEEAARFEEFRSKPIRIGFGGGGPSDLPDNQAIASLAASLGADFYDTSVIHGADLEVAIRDVLGQLIADNGPVYLFGYSAGGDAAIKLAADLAQYGIQVAGMVTFDPHGATRLFGSYDYTLGSNVSSELNLYQQGHAFIGSSNPFKGGSVSCPGCENIDLTGTATHLNIVQYGLTNYADKINSTLGH